MLQKKLIMKNFKAKTKIKKAVLLAGWEGAVSNPMNKCRPVWMLPVLNKPLIIYAVDCLKENGIEDVIIHLGMEEDVPVDLMKDKGLNIFYHVEERPRGSAGALKDVERYIDNKPFLVITDSLFVWQIKLNDFINFHFKKSASATVGVSGIANRGISEDITIGPDKKIKAFNVNYRLEENKTQWKSSGIYLFGPEVLELIDQDNYMDIKEQLIPALLKRNLKVFAHEIQGFYQSINSADDYINTQRRVLLSDDYIEYLADAREIAEAVWVGRNAVISTTAYLLGPVLIGNDCIIGDSAQVIGPTVLGNGCSISDGALVRESILWDGVSLSNHSRVEFSIVGEASNIPYNYNIRKMIALNGFSAGNVDGRYYINPLDISLTTTLNSYSSMSKVMLSKLMYRLVKRTMDITFSFIGVIILLPVFLLLGFFIKWDSSGPVFYIQNRCGIRGKLFGMIKFRTMTADAEKLHQNLMPLNQADGPVFKILDDPRVTKVGSFLRRTSLDELPQLFNVLKGEMSLVGPRPLITDEMRFSSSWRATRLKVKPGITGLWQVQGRSETHFCDWIKYDVYYVQHQSSWLDLKILFKTTWVVIKRIGAY